MYIRCRELVCGRHVVDCRLCYNVGAAHGRPDVCVCVCADSSYKFLSVRKHGSGGFLSVHVL
jgi:hypothetical protein